MIDHRPVVAILGILLVVLAAMMLVPAVADALTGHPDWLAFLACAGVTAFVGVCMWLTGRQETLLGLSARAAFLLTALSWIVTSAFAALPFMWTEVRLPFAAAYFEAMSGLTTTGGTAVVKLDERSAGVLLWRSILHFYGGIGIIVIAIMVLPLLRIGGLQLFRMESSDKSDKLFPRAAQIASATFATYVALIAACAIAFMLAGKTPFDAINHAMSTIATGGMAVSDSSLGKYQSAAVDWIAIVFMLSGALPILLFYRMTFGGDPLALFKSVEVRVFLCLIVAFSILLWGYLEATGQATGHDAIRWAIFNVVTLITTTGFATVDYTNWGPFSDALLFVVTFLGGCTGSTAGGIKAFRIIVLWQTIRQQFRRVIYPNGMFKMSYGGKPLDDDVVGSVMSFLVLYFATFVGVGLALSATGMDFSTAYSATIANLANTGPGLGAKVGPAGNYADLMDIQYWLLSFAMLVGRLEIVTLFVLLLPRFWRH